MKMRSVLITLGSVALTTCVLANAYWHKRQFYPTVVYITKSSPSMAVLYLQALVLVLLLGKLMRQIFFSQLRSAELEHLIERSWYAVTETCLAFTVFRDDFSPRFVALFTILLFLKCFHWLAEDRIDYMERSPVITTLFHVRAVSLLMLLGMLDVFFVKHAYANTLIKGPSVQLVFGFEYAVLVTVVAHIFVKYMLHTVDAQRDMPWDNKAVYLLYAELGLGFVKCILYMCFLIIMVKVHTFPLFVIRPMYLTIREFRKALNDVIMSRRAIYNMNTLYPDATADDLAAGDNVCIICREEMHAVGAGTVCKKLPCSHIFHASCLRSWFQRQQTCPTCRMDVLRHSNAETRPAAARPAPEGQPAAAQPANQWMPVGGPALAAQWIPAGGPAAPGAAGIFQGWPGAMPPGWPQGHPLPQSTGEAASAAAGYAAAQAAFAMPPPLPPPFSPMMMCPPSMPFMPPMCPSPPPNLAALSEEELRVLEGTERASVEARIRCLQDISVLLTAALTQMNQFITHAPQSQPIVSASALTMQHSMSGGVSVQSAQSVLAQSVGAYYMPPLPLAAPQFVTPYGGGFVQLAAGPVAAPMQQFSAAAAQPYTVAATVQLSSSAARCIVTARVAGASSTPAVSCCSSVASGIVDRVAEVIEGREDEAEELEGREDEAEELEGREDEAEELGAVGGVVESVAASEASVNGLRLRTTESS